MVCSLRTLYLTCDIRLRLRINITLYITYAIVYKLVKLLKMVMAVVIITMMAAEIMLMIAAEIMLMMVDAIIFFSAFVIILLMATEIMIIHTPPTPLGGRASSEKVVYNCNPSGARPTSPGGPASQRYKQKGLKRSRCTPPSCQPAGSALAARAALPRDSQLHSIDNAAVVSMLDSLYKATKGWSLTEALRSYFQNPPGLESIRAHDPFNLNMPSSV